MGEPNAAISKNELTRFLECASPGESLTYFKGVALGLGDEAVQELAAELRTLFLKGVVELVQKRNGTSISYQAVKRREVGARYNPWQEKGVPEGRLYAYPESSRKRA